MISVRKVALNQTFIAKILIIIGSPGEYGRLSLPAIPIYLIMLGQMLNMIRTKSLSEIKFV